jgi:catalase
VTITPEESIDAVNARYGHHDGYRALHAKGVLCEGTFTATPAAAALTRAAHMQGDPVHAIIRFSNGSGHPRSHDHAPDVRGMAVKLDLADGTRTDIVCQTAPRFPTHTPEGFVELIRALTPGPAQAWRLPLFFARHPEAIGGLRANAGALKPPASFATRRYYAIHAYRWVDGGGGARYVRYTWVPEAGEADISILEARRRGREYLHDELRERLTDGPVRFTLELQIAAAGDDVDDPAAVWPSKRERVSAGILEVTGLETTRERDGDILVFDPTRVVDGIELSADPVLLYRSPAYSASVERRSGIARPSGLD